MYLSLDQASDAVLGLTNNHLRARPRLQWLNNNDATTRAELAAARATLAATVQAGYQVGLSPVDMRGIVRHALDVLFGADYERAVDQRLANWSEETVRREREVTPFVVEGVTYYFNRGRGSVATGFDAERRP